MWIDSHAHLDRFSEQDLEAIIADAGSSGVGTVLATATDIPSAEIVVRRCLSFSQIYGAVGISPFDTETVPDGWEGRLRSMLKSKKVVAVGEIGLDQSNPKYPALEIQLPVFERQLHVALECGKPVIVHSRGAERRVAEMCGSLGLSRVLFHCFTGNNDALRFVLDNGYSVSFSGIVTFSSSVAELIPYVPLGRLFIESDAPYLAPVPHRGRPNRPAWVVHTGECVAQRKGVSSEELQAAVAENFKRLFLPP